MSYYLSLLDRLERREDENRSIGIILCAEKDHVEVELTLEDMGKPIGVADYQLESRTGFAMLDDKIRTEQYAVGFKLGNEELRDQVQSTLDEMVKDDTFDDIAKKWDLSDMVCLGK